MRQLKVFTDGEAFASGCRFHLSGRTAVGLFPSLFILEAWNLKERDYLKLANTKRLTVYRGIPAWHSGRCRMCSGGQCRKAW